MKKTAYIVLGVFGTIVLLVAIVGFVLYNFMDNQSTVPHLQILPGPGDTSFLVDGQQVQLVNGKAEMEVVRGSAIKEKFAIIDGSTFGDLNGDGDDRDMAMYLTRDSGGSGTFYYVVIAVNENGTYRGTNAIFLGDRIATKGINIINGNAVVHFAERKPGDPFSVEPSVKKSLWIHLDPKTWEIREWVKNFEGEANPSRMTLGMKTWDWVETEYADGTKISPKRAGVFSLAFNKDGSLVVKTDCNSMAWHYATKRSALAFANMISTLMFCEGSQEGQFSAMLGEVSGFHFTEKGELFLELRSKKGFIVFR